MGSGLAVPTMGCRCPRSVPWALHIFSPPWAPWCPLVGSSPPVPTRGHHCPLMGWISMVPIFGHLWARWCPLVPAWAPAVWCPRNGHQKSSAMTRGHHVGTRKWARRAHSGHQPNLVTSGKPPLHAGSQHGSGTSAPTSTGAGCRVESAICAEGGKSRKRVTIEERGVVPSSKT